MAISQQLFGVVRGPTVSSGLPNYFYHAFQHAPIFPVSPCKAIRLNAQSHEPWGVIAMYQKKSSIRWIASGTVVALGILCAVGLLGHAAQAQTFTVLHNFTGGPDGSLPTAALTLDRAGNVYGTASLGGSTNCSHDQLIGCGTAFKLSHHGAGWTLSVLYTFTGGSDGQHPETPVVFGTDGTFTARPAKGARMDASGWAAAQSLS